MSSNLDRDINRMNNVFLFKDRKMKHVFDKHCDDPNIAIECKKIKRITPVDYAYYEDNFYTNCKCIDKNRVMNFSTNKKEYPDDNFIDYTKNKIVYINSKIDES